SIAVATPAGRRGHYVSQGGELELTHDAPPDDAFQAARVSAAVVAAVAAARRAAGRPTGPDRAIYLREPDVAPPAGRKRLTPPPTADRSRPPASPTGAVGDAGGREPATAREMLDRLRPRLGSGSGVGAGDDEGAAR
ncbi:MAG: hypothetical protein J7480_07680, partial [Microbacteriaceae bacterium]|nr:hypothetical protein [Microbacteriaceae bacterium]